jgi:type III secretory pathway component EscT
MAALLGAWLPAPADLTAAALVAEALLGAVLGLLAGLPVHAAASLRGDGPEALGYAGQIWAWAVFFGMGGPGLLLLALARSFEAVPPGAWPSTTSVVEGGATLFHAALVLGLPAWLTGLLSGPIGALADRVGLGAAGVLTTLRPALTLLLLVALLPVLLDHVRGYWLAALGGP